MLVSLGFVNTLMTLSVSVSKMKLHGLKPVASWSEILKRPFFILALKGKVFWPRMYKIPVIIIFAMNIYRIKIGSKKYKK